MFRKLLLVSASPPFAGMLASAERLPVLAARTLPLLVYRLVRCRECPCGQVSSVLVSLRVMQLTPGTRRRLLVKNQTVCPVGMWRLLGCLDRLQCPVPLILGGSERL
jgi:hypothetical protein